MAVLTLNDACLAFGHVALLDHAAFSLETGERVGLIGRNGTGKSRGAVSSRSLPSCANASKPTQRAMIWTPS